MIQKISNEIAQYKSGDTKALLRILQLMEPLVIRYAKKTFSLEFEDAKQEYYIAIINACNKIKKYDNDAQCLVYLQSTIKNKYYSFCKDYFSTPLEIPIEDEIFLRDNSFDFVVINADLQKFFQCQEDPSGYKRKILYFTYLGMSDAEIGKELGITRQYVNILRKKLAEELKQTF